ncbi:MAG TPA: type II toxin-antitoxin system VapC family toxin [Kiritimatiellia bacterium]|nr:type II toxin-antitoxin system VapC family toxin [Lentisphaerota bacterium]HPC19152.1 type II toxin-antitoxin system VapC family toxin [Kiritimatiellia bacterium]HQQ60961.1 type II toxin-antitoxin system VapC family toxin [Kiritimatiellia bacterium]
MKAVAADTHPLVWWLLQPSRLSAAARKGFEQTPSIQVPTMALLEIAYLNEIGRIELAVPDVLAYIGQTPRFQLAPFDGGILLRSIELQATRDPFDRVIAATALYWQVPLITKDRWMQANLARTIW